MSWVQRWMGLLALSGLLLAGCGGEDVESVAKKDGLQTHPYALPFVETFSAPQPGWQLGPEWQIGPATASAPDPNWFTTDPGTDVTPTADNRIAGVNLGGDYASALHGYYYLTSPVVNASGYPTVTLSFYRWLLSDYPPGFVANTIDAFDGAAWQNVWTQPDGLVMQDSSWVPLSYDLTPFANSRLRVRFGFQVIDPSGMYIMGGWNIDDVSIN